MRILVKKLRILFVCILSFTMIFGMTVSPEAASRKACTPKITLSKTSFTWNSKERKPSLTVKAGKKVLVKGRDYTVQYKNNTSVGKASVKVVLKGKYKGSATAYFSILPKGTALKTLSKTANDLTVTWKKQSEKMSKSRITGYQVQIAADKSFTKSKKTVSIQGYNNTSCTFSNLKRGTRYYVRIRTYKTVKDKRYYSAWSEIKSKKDKVDPKPDPDPIPAPAITLNDLKLADTLYAAANDNTIVSPTSVNFALAMLLEGAQGSTKTELESYLGVSKEELDAYVCKLFQCIFDDGELQATISNAFWHKPGQVINPDYLQKLTALYGAEIGELDFLDGENAAGVINDWCSEKTKGLIPSIVTPEIVQGVADVVLNTVYFKDRWAEPIEKEQITPGEFNGFDEVFNVEYLHSTERNAFENDQAIAFEKPYKEKYSFIGILPKSEGDFTLESLDIPALMANRITDYDEVLVTMPKFSIESGGDITELLQNLGLQQSFSPYADFSGIAEDLMLSSAVHKTKMILDENGTEAAAATAIAAKDSASLVKPKSIKIELTRPYAFLIMDKDTGTVLFLGKVICPQ